MTWFGAHHRDAPHTGASNRWISASFRKPVFAGVRRAIAAVKTHRHSWTRHFGADPQ
jgi:hypothetical protein